MGYHKVSTSTYFDAVVARLASLRTRAFSLFLRLRSLLFGLRVAGVDPFVWWLDARLLIRRHSEAQMYAPPQAGKR